MASFLRRFFSGRGDEVLDINDLVRAYHALIDLEREKYEKNNQCLEVAWFRLNEALGVISSVLSKRKEYARRVFDKLCDEGFIVNLGDDRYRTIHFDVAYRVSNITVEYGSLRYPLEARIFVRDEELPRFDDHRFEELRDVVDFDIYEILKFALFEASVGKGDGIKGFSDFQFRAIKALIMERKKAYILTAPTSGGKTYAFIIPALVRVLRDKLQKGKENVKVMLIYPRKALERDQLNKLLTIIYRINYYLANIKYTKGVKKHVTSNVRITVGIDDGETPWGKNVRSGDSFRGALCPSCGRRLIYFKSVHGLAKTKPPITVRCENCRKTFDWIYGYREQIWSQKPDILITNVWTLDYRLPSKTIESDYAVYKGVSMIILDEAHVYQSLLGGNIRYLLKRLKIASQGEPIIVLSSATISKPRDFGKEILDLEADKEFEVVESGGGEAKKKVIYLIMAVHPQRSWETVVYELALLLAIVFKYRGLQSVIFIDSIRELYRIRGQMLRVATLYYREPKDHFDPNIVSDLNDPYNYQVYLRHGDKFNPKTTPEELFNYVKIHHAGIRNREQIEQEFANERTGVLLSTSTLELGVDYPNVSIVATVGVPFMLESIPQRIGRAGRNPIKTLNTILAIIILRNTPMELYYMYKPEDLVEGFKRKNIPVAWKNIAVKKYHALFTIFDEMARDGVGTYILRTDGILNNLMEFIDKVTEYIDKRKHIVQELDSRTEKDEDSFSEIIREVKKELQMIPRKADKLRETRDSVFRAHGIFTAIRRALKLIHRLAKELDNKELIREISKARRMLSKILEGKAEKS